MPKKLKKAHSSCCPHLVRMLYCSRHIAQSIASFEELAKAPDGASIHFPFSDSSVANLNEMNTTRGVSAALEIDKSSIIAILDQVRTIVLDWAIEMEKGGVVGTEFNFS